MQLWVDNARGVVGYGKTYGGYSYNHRPLFGGVLQPGLRPGESAPMQVSLDFRIGSSIPSRP
jgi:hypothetical protein